MGIVNEGSNEGHGFLWDETLKAASSNHVMTCIWMYILLSGHGERNLRLTLDNCAVNKSYMFVAFCMTLVIFRFFDQVDLCWLVAGHTKFSPDRMFGLVSSALKVTDVTTKENWCKLISEKTGEGYHGKVVETILDFTSALEVHFRTTGFLSLDRILHRGEVKIKSLQGVQILREGEDIRVLAMSNHPLSPTDRETLQALSGPPSQAPPPGLTCKLNNLYTVEERTSCVEVPMHPPIPVLLIK